MCPRDVTIFGGGDEVTASEIVLVEGEYLVILFGAGGDPVATRPGFRTRADAEEWVAAHGRDPFGGEL